MKRNSQLSGSERSPRNNVMLPQIFLAFLFSVGNTLIRYPWRQNNPDLLWIFAASAAGALIPAFLLYPLFCKFYRSKLSGFVGKSIGVGILSVALGGYALFCGYRAADDYVGLVKDLILPDGNRGLLIILFLTCTVLLANVSSGRMHSFALAGGLLVLFTTLSLFLAGFSVYRPEELQVELPNSPENFAKAVPILLTEFFLPLTVLSLYAALSSPKRSEAPLAIGTGIGCLVLLLCILQTVLTFGISFSAGLSHPYSYAVRVISVGQYYFRLEGLSYLLNDLSCLIRTAVCLSCARRLFARFFIRQNGKTVTYLCGLAYALLLLRK